MAQQEDDGHSETSSLIIAVSSPGPSLLVSGQTTLDYMSDTRSTNVFKWLKWIIMDEHKLAFCKRISHNAMQVWTQSLLRHSRNTSSSIEIG